MQYNRLGQSDLMVSEFGFGCMSLSSQIINSGDLIRVAFDHGINFFDTADLYEFGENEKLIGDAVKSFRKDVILSTKVGNEWNLDKSSWSWNASKEYILTQVDKSLRRLKTDYIDLYQLHGGTIEDRFEEVIEAFEILKKSGKILNYGISSIRPNVFLKYLKHANIVSNMMQYNLLDTRPEEYFSEFREYNVSVIARGSLAKGMLIDKESTSYLGLELKEIDDIKNQLSRYSVDFNVSKEAISLYSILKREEVAVALVGIRTEEQLKNLIKANQEFEILRKSSIDIKTTPIRYTDHRK